MHWVVDFVLSLAIGAAAYVVALAFALAGGFAMKVIFEGVIGP